MKGKTKRENNEMKTARQRWTGRDEHEKKRNEMRDERLRKNEVSEGKHKERSEMKICLQLRRVVSGGRGNFDVFVLLTHYGSSLPFVPAMLVIFFLVRHHDIKVIFFPPLLFFLSS